ncbi:MULTISPECIES: DUF2147 domain-containing protein [Falsihalocynthiibacter]|jgi:uncharacterized protein (DUF2147 family)|uniref:Imidazoleglycerol-phosphate dehydratase n=1 Tax=Falsihalocynthiibacter arcticus TaxID=1579316 RepID=A0A126UW72_9RHOB|nr:DUF2147 domain-containing protein [Falsihalocynthiibacter arcticus]AML49886.1 imidazoleglycerol-phosphate dehydratase [Falsihalocynthiibacter arcticus]
MKTLLTAAAALVLSVGAGFADPIDGTWKTEVDDGAYAHIAVAPCGDKICGVIARTFDSSGETKSPNIGKQLVWDMSVKGEGAYAGGKIWQPSKDKVYKSKMALNGNTLKVSGCVGPICKKQTWSRVN